MSKEQRQQMVDLENMVTSTNHNKSATTRETGDGCTHTNHVRGGYCWLSTFLPKCCPGCSRHTPTPAPLGGATRRESCATSHGRQELCIVDTRRRKLAEWSLVSAYAFASPERVGGSARLRDSTWRMSSNECACRGKMGTPADKTCAPDRRNCMFGQHDFEGRCEAATAIDKVPEMVKTPLPKKASCGDAGTEFG